MLLLYTTFADEQDATETARELVEERLVACANMLPMESVYRWDGEVVEDSEVLLLAKTTEGKTDAITKLLHDIHPYDVPCIAFYEAEKASGDYQNWVESCLSP
jgi:periplasmic divalent cation tolerance protein